MVVKNHTIRPVKIDKNMNDYLLEMSKGLGLKQGQIVRILLSAAIKRVKAEKQRVGSWEGLLVNFG